MKTSELFEEVSTAQKLGLRSVERVLSHVAQVPSDFPCPSLLSRSFVSSEDEALSSHISNLVK